MSGVKVTRIATAGQELPSGYSLDASYSGSDADITVTTPGGPDVALVTVTSAGATETIDVSVARTYDVTLTADCTLTLTGAVADEAWWVALLIRQDGTGGWDVTWPGSVEWPTGGAPTIDPDPNALTVVTLGTVDGGTVWLGFPTGGGGTGATAYADLTDVDVTGIGDGDHMLWDAGTSTWLPAAPGGVAELTDIPTAETDTALVLHPDGAGGVEWGADATGGGGSTGARYPVQDKPSNWGSGNSAALTLGTTPTNGNLLIAMVAIEGSTNVSSITQTNVTWTRVEQSTASTSPHCEIWKGVVAASAGTGVTVAFSGSTYCGFHCSEWSGVTGTLDQSAVSTNVSNRNIPTITPTDQTALVITGGATSSYGSGFSSAVGPGLLQFANSAGSGGLYGVAFGFLGTSPVIGYLPNSNGTFSGVTVSLT
jgi:hypothetical protein